MRKLTQSAASTPRCVLAPHLTPSLSDCSKGITACMLGDALVFNEAEMGRDFWGHKRVWGEVGTLKWCEVVVNYASGTAGSPTQR